MRLVGAPQRTVVRLVSAVCAATSFIFLCAPASQAFASLGAAVRTSKRGSATASDSQRTARAEAASANSFQQRRPRTTASTGQVSLTAPVAAGALLCGLFAGLQRSGASQSPARTRASVSLRATKEPNVNYLELMFKGDLPKRILTVLLLLGLARVGYYIPLYGFDPDATQEFFTRQASSNLGFIDQLFGGGLGKVSLFSLGIGPFITASIIFQILTQVQPSLKALAQGEEGESGRDKYKLWQKYATFFFALVQGFGQSQTLSPFVFDNGILWSVETTLQLAAGAMITVFIADEITKQKLGNGSSLLVFSSIVSNLPRTIGSILAKAGDAGYAPAIIFGASLIVTILGLVYILAAERRIPILFARRLQDESMGQGGSDDAGQSYLPIKLNASGVLPLIFAGSLVSLPALLANYTRIDWLQPIAKSVLPGAPAHIPLSMVLIFVFSYVSTFQVLNPKDMATSLRKQAAAIPQVRPGRETEQYLSDVLSRASIFGALILASLYVLPNAIELLTKLSTPNSFGGTSLLILVGVAADTWRQLQAELLMQQYATDVDQFYKGARE